MAGSMIGRVFNNRYKIIERIGIGGMAEVYRAQDNTLGRTVAVKVMLPQFAADPTFAQRFRQEAASAANLQSPYIVNIYDWGQDEGTYYIVMEYVRGSDLKKGITERGTINQRKVAEIGSQVCQALHVAHGMDIIHRDIKPQNIMVQPDGNVKVMDFGIARAKNTVESETSTVLGTAHYISPEQAQGKELDATSDIYSLGIVMYEAVTGKLPFDGPDAVSVATQQVNDMPLMPSAINPNIDGDLEAIIWKAIQKKPRDRFATASDMRRQLNAYLSGRPVTISAPSDFARSKTTVLGGRGDYASAGATQVMNQPIGAASGYKQAAYVAPNVTGKSATIKKQEPERGKNRVAIVAAVVAVLVVLAVGAAFALGLFGGKSGNPVPDVTGKTLTEATTILKEAGFVVGSTDKAYNDKYDADVVCSQDPAADSKHEAGTKINLVVSLGKEQITVPDLTNKTAQEAQSILQKLGLTASAGTASYSKDIGAGKIMGQNPAAGTKIAKGSSVEYILSLGTEIVAVPNVVGYTQSEAKKTLTEAGFEVEVTEQYSDYIDKGKVISQSPNSGKLEKGQKISIVVSSGEDPANQPKSIPNVVGKTVSAAKSELEAAGFTVYVAGDDSSSAKVTAQSQTGTAKPGTQITITGAAQEKEPTPSGNTNTNS